MQFFGYNMTKCGKKKQKLEGYVDCCETLTLQWKLFRQAMTCKIYITYEYTQGCCQNSFKGFQLSFSDLLSVISLFTEFPSIVLFCQAKFVMNMSFLDGMYLSLYTEHTL